MGAIEIRDLCFSYDDNKIFTNLSFLVQNADFCTILGPNGSGKTTLLKCIAGLLKPESGGIIINGKKIEDYNIVELARNISYVPQYQDIVFDVSVFDYVMMGRNPYQGPWALQNTEDIAIVEEALESCNVLKFKNENIQSLSGGERQRVMIARAIAQRSPIMLLDEPLANIDVTHKFEIMDILERLNSEQKVTIVIILHDFPITMQYTHKVLMLKSGEVQSFGDVKEVMTRENLKKCFEISDKLKVEDNGYISRSFLMD